MSDHHTPSDVQPGERVPAGAGVMFLWVLMVIALVCVGVFAFETIPGILRAVS
jgi:hypothetical protein